MRIYFFTVFKYFLIIFIENNFINADQNIISYLNDFLIVNEDTIKFNQSRFEILSINDDYAYISENGYLYKLMIQNLNISETIHWPLNEITCDEFKIPNKTDRCLNKILMVFELNNLTKIICGFKSNERYCEMRINNGSLSDGIILYGDEKLPFKKYAFDKRQSNNDFIFENTNAVSYLNNNNEIYLAVSYSSFFHSISISKHIFNDELTEETKIIALHSEALVGKTKFLKTLNDDESVYYFFHSADEDNSDKWKFKNYNSYIGKLCLNDNGLEPSDPAYYGTIYKFLSFRQMKMYCSIRDDHTYVTRFDKLVFVSDLIKINNQEFVFALFHLNRANIVESVICSYNLNEIKEGLDSLTKLKSGENIEPVKCNDLDEMEYKIKNAYRIKLNVNKYQAVVIKSLNSLAVYYGVNEKLLSLEIDSVNNFIYASVDDGRVLKIKNNNLYLNSTVIQESVLFKNEPAKYLKINKKRNSNNDRLMVFSDQEIKSVRLVDCNFYKQSNECLSEDLFCVWNLNNKCIRRSNENDIFYTNKINLTSTNGINEPSITSEIKISSTLLPYIPSSQPIKENSSNTISTVLLTIFPTVIITICIMLIIINRKKFFSILCVTINRNNNNNHKLCNTECIDEQKINHNFFSNNNNNNSNNNNNINENVYVQPSELNKNQSINKQYNIHIEEEKKLLNNNINLIENNLNTLNLNSLKKKNIKNYCYYNE